MDDARTIKNFFAVHCVDIESKMMYNRSHERGYVVMKIAVTYDNGQIFQHFGHTAQFKLYDTEDGRIVDERILDTNGSGHGALAGLLALNGADVLICGGIGGGAQTALKEAGIKLYGGVSGSADDAVKSLLDGTLDFDINVHCDHHGHEHGGAEHNCSQNGCGGHSCH